MTEAVTGLELRSKATSAGTLDLSLEPVTLDPPGEGEVIVRVEAAPINPSDLGLLLGPLLGPVDPASARAGGTAELPTLAFDIAPERMAMLAARLDESLPVGNEGAGTVVQAGPGAEHLIGKIVGMLGGAMYAQYRKLPIRDVVPLKDGQTAADGASMFVNPLTALGFVETMRMEGHSAIVHTAAASNLGQMLARICLADGVPLVNIVRSDAQTAILRDIGATHIVNSTAPDFREQLAAAVRATGATIAFDAIGGGKLGGQILTAMEAAASAGAAYSRYGSTTFKQLYIYGALDTGPTMLSRNFGFSWAVSGWLLTPFMGKAGKEIVGRMRQRVVDELTTTFASKYTQTIGLAEALQPKVVAAYNRKATGEKYLIDPTAVERGMSRRASDVTRPVLFLDSGVGGLSVLAPARALLPRMPVVYVADTAGYPYGTKSEEEIAGRVPALLGRLAERYRPRLIVIACNTASTIALAAVRAALDVPVVGTVPAIRPAAELSRTRVIGVLGTQATVRQPYVDDLTARFAADCTVLRHGSAALVDLAEAKLGGAPPDRDAYRAALAGLFDRPAGDRIDVVVNACTHFPLVADELAAAAPHAVTFVDGGPGIARRIAHLTAGQDWPEVPVDGVAVFTRLDAAAHALAPALAQYGLGRLTAL